jgi:hypothetical protein
MFIEPRVRLALLSTLAALPLFLTSGGAAEVSARQATPSSPAGASSVTPAQSCDPLTGFDRNNFSTPTTIDNQWFPLVPGTQFILKGHTGRGPGLRPHRVVFTVTDLTKEINGVRTVVLWDRDYSAGQLVEAELAFHAQDNAGNVWNLGEYPEEYENGEFLGAPNTWIAGEADAEAGVLMLAEPREGTPPYRQGWAPEIEFADCGQVFATGQQTRVPAGRYANVLVIDEWDQLDPEGGHQRKYYAPGVGNIYVAPEGDPEGETLALVEVVRLSPEALAQARAAALQLEQRAYEISEVYGQTPPAAPAP